MKQIENKEDEEQTRFSKYPKLDDSDSNKGACCVIISEYLNSIEPEKYFITTGEAIQKIDILIEDINKLLKSAKKFRKSLIKAKGSSKYLETGWEDGVLILKQKNLRIK